MISKHADKILKSLAQYNSIQLNALVYSLCRRAIIDTANRESVVSILEKAIEDIQDQETKNDLISTIADVLVQCSAETLDLKDTEPRQTFVAFVKCLLDMRIVTVPLMRERFDDDTSEAVGIFRGQKRFTRIRTRLYFTQPKYNLLHKENEGFARLLTLLANFDQGADKALAGITKLTGKYSLDPNRALDMILYSFECNPTKISYHIDIFKIFMKNDSEALAKLLLLKLNFYLRYRDGQRPIAPTSLYRVIAQVLHHELIELDELYPNLSPKDSQILEYHKFKLDEARAIVKKINMVTFGEERPIQTEDTLSESSRHILEIDNSKLRLCSNLLRIGNWSMAHQIAKKLPEYYCFSDPHVSNDACDLVSYMIDPLYRKVCGLSDLLVARIKPYRKKESFPQQVNTVEELRDNVFPIIQAVGPFLSADQIVVTKLIRILKHIITSRGDDNEWIAPEGSKLFYQVIVVLDEAILPAASMSDGNCCLSRELWSLVYNFKYPIRYKLYYNWREEPTNPTLLRTRAETLLNAKYYMKRLSKDTIKVSGRHIGKLCYSNPTFTLGYILTLIQSYDNLIGPVVDALKFLTPLAHDVLIYCIIEALIDPKKDKHTCDGASIAQWLLSLATFCASVIRKYNVEFSGFLQFIANQLKAGRSLDLLMLTELIQKMTGIETTQGMTNHKIEALSGGKILRIEGAYFNQVKNTRKSSARLKDALIESELAMPLCILMAQLRDCIFFNQQDETHIKLLGKLYDQCQETFVQYGAFLSLSIDDYVNYLPPLERLMTDYKLNPDAAFFLARPMIFHRIYSRFTELKQKTIKDANAGDRETSVKTVSEALIENFIESTKGVLDPIIESISNTCSANYCRFGPNIFVLFWTLSMYDLEVPQKSYEREIERILKKSNNLQIDDDKDIKRKKERERYANLVQKLRDEEAEQQDHCKFILNYLEREKDNLFAERTANNIEIMHFFIQHCLFSRSILTASDAIYSARFIVHLHEMKIKDFCTIICYDRLLCDITYMMAACTENEANHYGRFLSNILKTIMHWHSSKEVYYEECASFPGFHLSQTEEKDVGYENYRHLCHKWHYRLTKAFVNSLESNNYVRIRNALIVLISIIEYYPKLLSFGQVIEMRLETVRTDEREQRHDLYALATAYAGRLESKKSTFVGESDFHIKEETNQRQQQSQQPPQQQQSPSQQPPQHQSQHQSQQQHQDSDYNRSSSKRRHDSSRMTGESSSRSSSKSRASPPRANYEHKRSRDKSASSISSKNRVSPPRANYEHKRSSRDKSTSSIDRKRAKF